VYARVTELRKREVELNGSDGLQSAFVILRGVLEGELTHANVCRIPSYRPRLVVAHAVMHGLPTRFFHPGTTRLLGHYGKVLALLVGETPFWSSDLVQASYKLLWHRPVKGVHSRSAGSVRLATPPEVLGLLNDWVGVEYAVSKFYKQALARDNCFGSKDV
jgi:hypothetical protein